MVQFCEVHFKRLVGADGRGGAAVRGQSLEEVVGRHNGGQFGGDGSCGRRAGVKIVHGGVDVSEEDIVQGQVSEEA